MKTAATLLFASLTATPGELDRVIERFGTRGFSGAVLVAVAGPLLISAALQGEAP